LPAQPIAAPAGMLRQERPHLRQFQRSDPVALKGAGLDRAVQFGRWACQSSAPNETIAWPKTPCPRPPVWSPCPSTENTVNSHNENSKV
jgi:hypothetical protein